MSDPHPVMSHLLEEKKQLNSTGYWNPKIFHFPNSLKETGCATFTDRKYGAW